MQHQNHFAIGLLVWLVSGGFVGYLVHVQNESRVDWPVGFSSKEDFVPVHLHPTHAEITRDWTRWGGGRRDEDDRAYRYAIWLDVDYHFGGQRRSSKMKYRGRMSANGAEMNAHWAMQPENWPIEGFVNKEDPDILTPSLYYSGRTADIYLRNGLTAGAAALWIFYPLYHWIKKWVSSKKESLPAFPPQRTAEVSHCQSRRMN